MTPEPDRWSSLPIDDIQPLLGDFDRWSLCGGSSIDLLLGRKTREHGDTDIGVFRSDLEDCLTAIGRARVFLCDPPGELSAWDGEAVPERVHDIWIADADGEHWLLQILVFDDETHVHYKRDRSIRWSKASHTQRVDGRRALNPLITFLHKAHRDQHDAKDLADLRLLVDECAVVRRGRARRARSGSSPIDRVGRSLRRAIRQDRAQRLGPQHGSRSDEASRPDPA